MTMKRPRVLTLILTVALFAAACGSDTTSVTADGADPATGPDGDWVLSSATLAGDDLALVPDHRVTMNIDGATIGGTAACNGYGGTIDYSEDALRIGELSWTEMGCAPDVMALESAVLTALLAVDDWDRTGTTLRLTGPDTVLTFAAVAPVPVAELIGTTWTLDTLIEGEAASTTVASADPATLQLGSDGTLTGSTGCRELSGEYVITGDEVTFTSFAADGECSADVAAQDNLVVSVLGDGFTVSIDGSRMTAMSTGGEGLSYTTS